MTDRELLELAAKAADIGGRWGDQIDYHNGSVDLTDYWILDGDDLVFWNPLTDDGDALRLASDLCLNIEWFPGQKFVQACRFGIGEIIGWVDESGRPGSLRRAITVAAAKIGKSMEKSQ